ncbi:hypothetical protein POX_d06131 [Penicillium oxalicum]|uniref:Hemerythrin-like domain-containing protein n=1 Tax=Penicillium oxalicum (strain 114-2 / CGMCC 5302) TaxID=933388 RepID=S7ZSI0_PENO1|nr:hypothetical protein POX_d06131 [Penicillium oxalicum]EPS31676.1 hypothetical protein PDE_06633 [Penicillium oxalicum 114-2]KAI2790610.1 hypothetical protein POX_d06131 [Penicillium oxalicum]
MDRLTDAISADHRELQAYFDRLVHSDDPDEQTRFQNQLTWGLARHVVGEELVLFPALDRYLGPGEATQDRRQNQTIKEKLQVFQDLAASDPRFISTVTLLMDDLASHAHVEESKDLVKLEGAITAEESKRLAKSFGRTKWFAPTRAHPNLPASPYPTVSSLMAAPKDHLVDIFRKWPDPEDLPHLD